MKAEELFPREVTSAVPYLTLTGMEKLHVEQHRGVVSYQPDEIVLRTACGQIKVMGDSLLFQMYTSAEAVIVGMIGGVVYEAWAGGQK